MKIFSKLFLLLSALIWPGMSLAGEGFIVDHHLSSIKGSIKYTVIGTYRAQFKDFDGLFYFYPEQPEKSSVNFKILAATIQSDHPALDNIVRSKQLLAVEQYPEITFQSRSIKKMPARDEYLVSGDLTLHGVTKTISFPFEVHGPYNDHNNWHVEAVGTWLINRKDFNIYWHPFFDKGGVLVGNHLTVNWRIVAFKKP